MTPVPGMRTFETGATRDLNDNKLDYNGFLSPLALRRYAEFMHKNRFQADGSVRAGGNWKKGITLESFGDSAWRHWMDFWMHHQGYGSQIEVSQEEAICALLFNLNGYLHESVKARLAAGAGASGSVE